jgi:signal peptidase I
MSKFKTGDIITLRNGDEYCYSDYTGLFHTKNNRIIHADAFINNYNYENDNLKEFSCNFDKLTLSILTLHNEPKPVFIP